MRVWVYLRYLVSSDLGLAECCSRLPVRVADFHEHSNANLISLRRHLRYRNLWQECDTRVYPSLYHYYIALSALGIRVRKFCPRSSYSRVISVCSFLVCKLEQLSHFSSTRSLKSAAVSAGLQCGHFNIYSITTSTINMQCVEWGVSTEVGWGTGRGEQNEGVSLDEMNRKVRITQQKTDRILLSVYCNI